MKIYHFTNVAHLPSILANGYIEPSASNLRYNSAPTEHPVVWLTSNESTDVVAQKWAKSTVVNNNPSEELIAIGNKTRLRFVFDFEVSRTDPRYAKTPHCYSWDWWSKCVGRETRWTEALKKTAGDWRAYYVYPDRIQSGSWLAIEDTLTGETVWANGLTPVGEALLVKYRDKIEATAIR